MSLINRDVKKYVFEEEYKRDKQILFCAWLVVGLCTIAITATLRSVTQKHPQVNCGTCHNTESHRHQKMSAYFRKNGSPEPEVMANAVLRTRNPRLLAAVARVESNGRPALRSTGYRKRHHGAFQVSSKDWGKVSPNAAEQALQAEAILKELVEEKGGIISGLNQYGGDKTHKRYARTILAELEQVPR